jgi:hypothetical protein
MFPKVLAEIIAQYVPTWQMLPWIATLYESKKRSLRMDILTLWQNPNGIDMCLEMNLPMSWSDLSANNSPWAIARLLQHPEKIDWEYGVTNHSLPVNETTYIYNRTAACSPNDGESYEQYKINLLLHKRSECLNRNTSAIVDNSNIDWRQVFRSSHPDALQLLEANPDKIIWPEFLANPRIFEQRRDSRVVKILSE